MASSEEALACIEKLNHTELHGRIITVEKVIIKFSDFLLCYLLNLLLPHKITYLFQTTREPSGSIKRADLKSMQSKAPPKKSEKSTENSEGKITSPLHFCLEIV